MSSTSRYTTVTFRITNLGVYHALVLLSYWFTHGARPGTMAPKLIVPNTPEADKLENRLHVQLKELWDPQADATVARYLVAMLGKGGWQRRMHCSGSHIILSFLWSILLCLCDGGVLLWWRYSEENLACGRAGYERKKIHSQLKAILQEDISTQLLDW